MKRREFLKGIAPLVVASKTPAAVTKIEVNLKPLDGRALAEAIVPHLPSVIMRQGLS